MRYGFIFHFMVFLLERGERVEKGYVCNMYLWETPIAMHDQEKKKKNKQNKQQGEKRKEKVNKLGPPTTHGQEGERRKKKEEVRDPKQKEDGEEELKFPFRFHPQSHVHYRCITSHAPAPSPFSKLSKRKL